MESRGASVSLWWLSLLHLTHMPQNFLPAGIVLVCSHQSWPPRRMELKTSGDRNLRGGSWLWSAWTSRIFYIPYGLPKLRILLYSVWVGGRTAVVPLSMSSLLFTGRPRSTRCLPGSDGYVGLNEGDKFDCSSIGISSES